MQGNLRSAPVEDIAKRVGPNKTRLVELLIASALAAIVGAWLVAFAAVWLWSALT